MPLRAEIAPSRRTLTIATALVAANLTLFVLIVEDVADGGGLISHDEEVLAWFIDHRTEGLIRAAKLISKIGSFASRSRRPRTTAARTSPTRGAGTYQHP
jgi:hypothetical protein